MRTVLLLLACALAQAQAPAPGPLDRAYAALREKRYDDAIAWFVEALAANPRQAATRQDLAYTYLKTGETELARDQFRAVLELEPANSHAALEYAFLCNDTGRRGEARRTFDRLRRSQDPATRATAAGAFENIDRPLREGIQRWQQALALGADIFSTHDELARLAEDRDELELAATHYLRAWQLLPDRRSTLVALGRVWKALGQTEQANAALLAASRGGSARAAEEARALLPQHYPYVSEFRRALVFDPNNTELRRELAYLLLRMERHQEAEQEFIVLTREAPEDLLSAAQLGFLYLARGEREAAMPLLQRVLRGGDAELAARVRAVLRLPQPLSARPPDRVKAREAKLMAERSIRAGYMKDALRYLLIAQEADPLDFSIMLRLGWTYNVLHDDATAARWFMLASQSPDSRLAGEAARASRNLRPAVARVHVAAWAFPLYSSRWRDLFAYAQVKTELRSRFPVRPYLSVRLVADTRGETSLARATMPQYLSESALIFGFGLTSLPWHGLRAWGEAGSAVSYHRGQAVPDYRGGLAFARSFGHALGGESSGWFLDLAADSVYMSRFDRDLLVYMQSRLGYTLQPRPLRFQLYWNGNGTFDRARQYWANFAESGPGLRLRWRGLPGPMFFIVDWLRGSYTLRQHDPRGPGYTDFRAGLWYAFTY